MRIATSIPASIRSTGYSVMTRSSVISGKRALNSGNAGTSAQVAKAVPTPMRTRPRGCSPKRMTSASASATSPTMR